MTCYHDYRSITFCFIIEYYYPHVGGAEILFQKLAEGLVQEGHRCAVVTCHLPGTKRSEVVNGVHVHRVQVPAFADRYWFTFMSIPLAWKMSARADIIHTMPYNGSFPAWLVARMHGKPVAISFLEVLGNTWMKLQFNVLAALFCRWIERMILHLPYDAYLCISHYTRTRLKEQGIPRNKTFLTYPGIENHLFAQQPMEEAKKVRGGLGIGAETFLYTYYGRPGMAKGVEYLVRAVPLIRKAIPDSRLLLILANDPPTKYREIVNLIRTLNLDSVILHPSVPRESLPLYIQASDCVVVPSLSEGFGFTCVEACTMGKPVVASNVGSLPEVVFGTYVLVTPGDPASLADGVVRVFRGEVETSEEKAYHWEHTIRNSLHAYESMINRDSALF